MFCISFTLISTTNHEHIDVDTYVYVYIFTHFRETFVIIKIKAYLVVVAMCFFCCLLFIIFFLLLFTHTCRTHRHFVLFWLDAKIQHVITNLYNTLQSLKFVTHSTSLPIKAWCCLTLKYVILFSSYSACVCVGVWEKIVLNFIGGCWRLNAIHCFLFFDFIVSFYDVKRWRSMAWRIRNIII